MFRFFKRIKHIIRWLPLLWKDEDYDFGFLLLIMAFKLNRMARVIEKNNILASSKRHVRQIRYASYLITRLLEIDYPIKQYKIKTRLFRHMDKYLFYWWD